MTEEQLKKRLEDLMLAKGKSVINTQVLNGQIMEVEMWLKKIESDKKTDGRPPALPPSSSGDK